MTRTLPLSQPVFTILAALIEERLGLSYAPEDRDFLAERLSSRALECGLDSLLDYYYFLRYDEDAEREFFALAETLVVNETYFFRELAQVQVVAGVLVPAAIERHGRARIWCAACSTGEEPLTLTGLLFDRGLLPQVEILASDVSQRALDAARSGRFGRRSLRTEQPLPKWLERESGGVQVDRSLLASVDFCRVNLLDDAAVRALGSFDVILCRNVLIYFRDATASAVVARLEGNLRPGGHLLVGASESLLRFGTSLVCEERGGSFLYRKSE